MTRKQFLTELDQRLSSLPRREADEHLNYYAEMLADRMEEGMSEEEAVGSMESIDSIANRILGAHYTAPVQQKSGKNGLIIGIAAASVAVIGIVASLAVLLSTQIPGKLVSSTTGWGSNEEIYYTENVEVSESFAANEITNLEIDWVGGYVSLILWDGDTIELQETGARSSMFATAKGDTLYVKSETEDISYINVNGSDFVIDDSGIRTGDDSFVIDDSGIRIGDGSFVIDDSGIKMGGDSFVIDDSGIKMGGLVIDNSGIRWNGNSISDSDIQWNNDVLITIPEDQTSSLTVYIPRALAENGLDSIIVSVVSAEVEMFDINAKELSLTSISGGCVVNGSFDDATVSTTSGGVFLEGSFTDGTFNTVSGDLHITADDALRSFEVNSVSGEISLTIPEHTGFKLEFDTVSGEFFCGDFSVKQSGDKYTCGNGAVKMSADTISGNFILNSF